jgi:hypothetical protein
MPTSKDLHRKASAMRTGSWTAANVLNSSFEVRAPWQMDCGTTIGKIDRGLRGRSSSKVSREGAASG